MKNDKQTYHCESDEGIVYQCMLELVKHGISKDAFKVVQRLMIEEYERGLYDGENHVIAKQFSAKYAPSGSCKERQFVRSINLNIRYTNLLKKTIKTQ